MEHRERWIAVVLAVALGFLVVGWLGQDNDFALSLFVGLGTTLALAWPLFMFERVFQQRLDQAKRELGGQIGDYQKTVDDRVGQVETDVKRVDELSQRIADELARRRAADAESDFGPPRRFGEEKSFGTLREALRHSAKNDTIKDSAVFVPVPEHRLMVRFSLGEHGGIDVVAVADADRRRMPCVWSEDKPVEVLLGDLDTALRKGLEGNPPDHVRWSVMLADLAKTLELAEQRRVKALGKSFEPLLVRIDDNWLITEFTLEYTGEPRRKFDLDAVFGGARRGILPSGVSDPKTAEYAFAAANGLFLDHYPYT